MRTYRVLVEDKFGVTAIHLVDAVFPSTAQEIEESKGYRVLWVGE